MYLTEIILVSPLEAHLEIMILGNHPEKLIKEVRGLVLSHSFDALDVVSDGEYALPSSHWVGSNNGMSCEKFFADVERRAARFGVELEFLVFGGLGEERLGVGGCESVQEFFVDRREAVVDFVP